MSTHLVPASDASQEQPAWFDVTRHAGGARRTTLTTCIGCGALERFAGCDDGCSEDRQDLVGGAEHEAVRAAEQVSVAAIRAFHPIVVRLAQADATGAGARPVYEAVRHAARAALAAHAADRRAVLDVAPVVRTAWGCPRCGSLEAPEPCLGVCIRRPAEWVDAGDHEVLHRRALARRDDERALREVLELLVAVTPREGAWERSLAAFRARASAALGGR